MKKLEVFNKDERRLYWMPDDIAVNNTDNGIVFYTLRDNPNTVLWLPYSWGYVWIDELVAG